jgi:uncharacterized protein (DUF433 family)
VTNIVKDERHSDGAPTIEGTGIRVVNVACAYEHDGYSPDEIAEFYPALSLEDIHTAIAYYHHTDEFRDVTPDARLAAAYEEHSQRASRVNEEWDPVSSEATDDL